MGNWNEQQESKKEEKEWYKARRENLGKFFYDLAKLTFAGVVIGGIIPLYSNPINAMNWSMVVTGIIFTGLIAFFANRIFKH